MCYTCKIVFYYILFMNSIDIVRPIFINTSDIFYIFSWVIEYIRHPFKIKPIQYKGLVREFDSFKNEKWSNPFFYGDFLSNNRRKYLRTFPYV